MSWMMKTNLKLNLKLLRDHGWAREESGENHVEWDHEIAAYVAIPGRTSTQAP